MPLEQYNRQFYSLWDKISYSLIPQVEDGLWCDLKYRLQEELYKEYLVDALKEELNKEWA